jgi:acyl-CoA thioester hydrolase
MEQARIQYIKHLGLMQGDSFMDLGVILADIHITFRAPVQFGQAVRVGVRVSRMGNKSMDMLHVMEDAESGQELASGKAVLVAYDYHNSRSVPIMEEWRRVISDFEKL